MHNAYTQESFESLLIVDSSSGEAEGEGEDGAEDGGGEQPPALRGLHAPNNQHQHAAVEDDAEAQQPVRDVNKVGHEDVQIAEAMEFESYC